RGERLDRGAGLLVRPVTGLAGVGLDVVLDRLGGGLLLRGTGRQVLRTTARGARRTPGIGRIPVQLHTDRPPRAPTVSVRHIRPRSVDLACPGQANNATWFHGSQGCAAGPDSSAR